MAVTALDLIRGSIRLLGKPSEAENLSAEDADNALFALNEMLDLWSIKRFMVYHVRQDLLAWPTATVSRTIGPGATSPSQGLSSLSLAVLSVTLPAKTSCWRSLPTGINMIVFGTRTSRSASILDTATSSRHSLLGSFTCGLCPART